MSPTAVVLLVIAVCLVLLAGVFAALDAALQRLSKARVEELRRDGVKRAAALSKVVDDRARHVSLLLLLRIMCEMTAAVLVAVVFFVLFDGGAAGMLIAAAVMTVVSYVLIGVGPRTLGRQHAYRVAMAGAPLIRLLGRVLGPLSTLLILIGNAITPGRGYRDGPFSSEVELRELVDMAEERGVVEAGERNMIHSVFELGDTIAREVMVPRPDVVWIESTKSLRQALALALRSGFSRIPVIGENVDDVLGIVYLKDLVRRSQGTPDPRGGPRVEEIMRPARFVPESKPVDELLREMQAKRTHMAVVVDEYGGFAGLVTIEDILEEIVGEIDDEHDTVQRPPVEELPDGSVRITARLPVGDLADLFKVELPEDDDVETVGGLLARELGRVPIEGSSAEVGGLRLVAESTGGRRNRIDTLLVCRVPEPGAEDETGAERAEAEQATDRAPDRGDAEQVPAGQGTADRGTADRGDRAAGDGVREHTGATAVGSTASGSSVSGDGAAGDGAAGDGAAGDGAAGDGAAGDGAATGPGSGSTGSGSTAAGRRPEPAAVEG